ncbi:MAG TPA: hypothetical protein DCF89_05270 [Flavobacteriales bacterium]|nr:hypothetical protein [Flavobacteriales bacterium]
MLGTDYNTGVVAFFTGKNSAEQSLPDQYFIFLAGCFYQRKNLFTIASPFDFEFVLFVGFVVPLDLVLFSSFDPDFISFGRIQNESSGFVWRAVQLFGLLCRTDKTNSN